MASLRKRGGVWYFRFTDAGGIKRERRGCSDKRATEAMAAAAEAEAARVRVGLSDPRAEALRRHGMRSLGEHLDDFSACLRDRGATPKHVRLVSGRARRVAALLLGAELARIDPGKAASPEERASAARLVDETLRGGRLASLSSSGVQAALGTLKVAGRALETLNHHRAAVRAFARWALKDGRLRDDPLLNVAGYNAREDPRHDRRTISLEELRRLIDTTHRGPIRAGLTGPVRALLYRLAVGTGLRWSEIASITPGSFVWGDAPSVTVAAACTKNRDPATLPLPGDLAEDLRAWTATIAPGEPVWSLPAKGAELLRFDLCRAGIAYRDASGRIFDFHSLRGELATLADQQGISPRVVQRLMRHSSLALTDRYTRPRGHDIEGAVSSLPSLRPEPERAEPLRATGTTGPFAHHLPTGGDASGRSLATQGEQRPDRMQMSRPAGGGENPGFFAVGRPLAVPGGTKGASGSGGARIPVCGVSSRCESIIKIRPFQGLRQRQSGVAHPLPTGTRQSDPELSLVVARWTDLPPAVRAGIVAAVRSAVPD